MRTIVAAPQMVLIPLVYPSEAELHRDGWKDYR